MESRNLKIACFIPIKEYSERIRGKNFRMILDKPLYQYIIDNAVKSKAFTDIFVDTDSDEIKEYALKTGKVKIINRLKWLASNEANGNDLLNYHFELYPDYDLYFQLFATSPFLKPETITSCVEKLVNDDAYDSCFTAIEHKGFYWYKNKSFTYSPPALPRSQDMESLLEETTGLYGIRKKPLLNRKCRIGENPYIAFVDKFEAVDINTPSDLKIAGVIAQMIADEEFDLNK